MNLSVLSWIECIVIGHRDGIIGLDGYRMGKPSEMSIVGRSPANEMRMLAKL